MVTEKLAAAVNLLESVDKRLLWLIPASVAGMIESGAKPSWTPENLAAVDWLVRKYTPTWLRMVGDDNNASLLENLPAIDSKYQLRFSLTEIVAALPESSLGDPRTVNRTAMPIVEAVREASKLATMACAAGSQNKLASRMLSAATSVLWNVTSTVARRELTSSEFEVWKSEWNQNWQNAINHVCQQYRSTVQMAA